MIRRVLPLALPLLLPACVSAPKITAPRLAPPPPTLARPAPTSLDWKEAPVSVGGWTYLREAAGSAARFGMPGAAPAFELRCDMAARTIALSRLGTSGGTMTITTSFGARPWTVAARADGRVAITLPARDPFLDQLAFSRARFAVEGPGPGRLILPAWAEPSRVIEDCRA